MVLELTMNAAFVGKTTQSTTLLFTAPLRNHSYIKYIRWFNTTYNSQISPTMEELLFGITSNLNEKGTINKFNHITLFMRYFIYSCKLNNKSIDLHDFVNAVQQRGLIENTVNN